MGIDRKPDDAIWVRDVAWATRCVRDRAKLQSGARRRPFGKWRGPGARRFNPTASMTWGVMSVLASAAGPSISRRISANNRRGLAISASWNVTYRPCWTTLAPILVSFSRSVVSGQCSTSSGSANISCGSRADERGRRHEGLLLGVNRTKSVGKRTSTLECPLLGAERTYRQLGRRVRC